MAPVQDAVVAFQSGAPVESKTPRQGSQGAGRTSLRYSGVDPATATPEEAKEARKRKRDIIRQQITQQGGKIRGRNTSDPDVVLFTDSTAFVAYVSAIAFANMVVLGLEADHGCEEGWMACSYDKRMGWYIIENIFTILMLAEMAMRVALAGPRKYFIGDILDHPLGFAVGPCLDFTIVFLRVIDTWILALNNVHTPIKVISCFRIVHLAEIVRRNYGMRTFRAVWMVLNGVADAGRIVFWTCLIMALIIYVAAIVMTDQVMKQDGTDLYDYSRSAWKEKPWTVSEYWGTVPRSVLSMFQVVTLDHWASTLARPLVKRYPAYVLIFLPFLFLTVLSLLNVIVAIIVESTIASGQVNQEKVSRDSAKVYADVMDSLKEIFEEADEDGSGELDREELNKSLHQAHVRDRLKFVDLERSDMRLLFDTLDESKSGFVSTEKFFRGATRLRGAAMSCDLHHMSVDFDRYIEWCDDVIGQHRNANNRLGGLLEDVLGLDRDIVKAKHDERDPVLQVRRQRFKRQHPRYSHRNDLLVVNDGWDEGEDGVSEIYAPSDGSNQRMSQRQISKNTQVSTGTHRSSLVGTTLKKTHTGIDLNIIRHDTGKQHHQTHEEEYDEALRKYSNQHPRQSEANDVWNRNVPIRRAVINANTGHGLQRIKEDGEENGQKKVRYMDD